MATQPPMKYMFDATEFFRTYCPICGARNNINDLELLFVFTQGHWFDSPYDTPSIIFNCVFCECRYPVDLSSVASTEEELDWFMFRVSLLRIEFATKLDEYIRKAATLES